MGAFTIPQNFERTAPVYKPDDSTLKNRRSQLAALAAEGARKQKQPFFSNPQTELLCAMLELTNPNAVLMGKASYNLAELANRMGDEDEDDEDDDDAVGSGAEGTASPQVAYEPSPAKRVPVENPEEINLEDVACESDGENAVQSGGDEAPSAPISYEPGPVGQVTAENPEEINLDDVAGESDEDDKDLEEQGDNADVSASVPYEPSSVSKATVGNPDEIDLEDETDLQGNNGGTVSASMMYVPGRVNEVDTENPEVINLDDVETKSDDGSVEILDEEDAEEGDIYGDGNEECDENAYNPTPIVKNPEVIDIDDLDEHDSDVGVEAYVPTRERVEGDSVDIDGGPLAYDSTPASTQPTEVEDSDNEYKP